MNAKTSSLPALILLLLCPVLLISPKSLPLAPYRKGNHWGYANPKTGKIVVQPSTLDSVGLFPREELVRQSGRVGEKRRALRIDKHVRESDTSNSGERNCFL